MIADPVGHAVRLDAACVVVNLLDIPGHPGACGATACARSASCARVRPRGDAADGRAAGLRPGTGGCQSIVYERNVIQHANPARMTRALMAVVHDGATPDAALASLA